MASDGGGYGYIKISRKAYREDPYWNEKRTFSKWEAWEDLIQLAAWSNGIVHVGNEKIRVGRGDLFASTRLLASRWLWSTSRVHRFLKSLAESGRMVEAERTSAGSVYSIPSYEDFRGDDEGIDEPPEVRKCIHRSSRRTAHPPNYLYLMVGPGMVSAKIGISNDPDRRVREVRCPITGNSPVIKDVIDVGRSARALEKEMHDGLEGHRIKGTREWFFGRAAISAWNNLETHTYGEAE